MLCLCGFRQPHTRETHRKGGLATSARPEALEWRRKGGRIRRLYADPRMKDWCSKGGRVAVRLHPEKHSHGGRKVVELYPNLMANNGRIGGRIAGRRNVESGQVLRNGYGIKVVSEKGELFGSLDELTAIAVLKAAGGNPVHHPKLLELSNGKRWQPDVILGIPVLGLPSGVPIELKPTDSKGGIFWRDKSQHEKLSLAQKEHGAIIVPYNKLWDEYP